MRRPISERALTRLQLVGATALVAASVGLIALGISRSGNVAFVRHEAHARWITVPLPLRTGSHYIEPERPPIVIFERRFVLDEPPDAAVLHCRGLRNLEVWLNGEPVTLEGRDPERWKRVASTDVTAFLRRGENALRVEASNPEGPPLLQLWIDGLPSRLATGAGWKIRRRQGRVPAAVAYDRAEYPGANALPTPLGVLSSRAPIWLALFGLGALLAWRPPPTLARLTHQHAPTLALAVVGVFWLLLYALHWRSFPLHLGFDAESHANYLRFLASEHRLPVASDGWALYHPPLFYVATAALRGVVGSTEGSALDGAVVHLLPALCGLGSAWLAGRIARRVLADPVIAALAVIAAGLLPMNLYTAAFVSNEAFHAFWATATIAVGCELLMAERASWRGLAALAIVASFALLSKFTSLLVVPTVLFFLAAKLWLVEGRGIGRTAAAMGGLGVGVLGLAGWFYLRNWLNFGDPLVWNLDLPGSSSYWQYPGYHTPAWYLSFGEALVRPYFSGFASVWDGLYSSFWGDGYASGRMGVEYPNPYWNYDWMAAVYLLALPATAVGLLGYLTCVREALCGAALRRRLALALLTTLAYGIGFSVFWMTFPYPFYSMSKAFYGLAAVGPVGVAFAVGYRRLDGWLALHEARVARALLWGTSSALAGAIVLAFLG